MKLTKKILLIFSITALAAVSGCNLDVNVDPNSPASVPNAQLLPSAQVAIFESFGNGGSGLGQVAGIWTHQTMIRSNADQYGATGGDANIGNPWVNLYSGALTDIELIISQATKDNQPHYSGIAKILKAYSYHMMVDVWGDIPFSEAVKGAANQQPKFDDDAAIYAALFPLIDEGMGEIALPTAGIVVPGTDDVVYAGNLAKWRIFAKALKLKMYNTVRGTPVYDAAAVTALMADPDVTSYGGATATNEFELRYFNVNAPENRNPSYLSVSGATTYFSRYLYEIMIDKVAPGFNNHIFDFTPGVSNDPPDPRLFYYLYRSLGPTANPTNPTEYRDGQYIAINFSSQGPAQGFDQSNAISSPGLYFAGGKFDTGAGGTILVTSFGTGAAPQRLLCQYEVLYIRSEVAMQNADPVTARTLLSSAIDASFAKVNTVAATAATGVPAISNAARDTYRNSVLAVFDAGSAATKLEVILTQKWLANFGNPLSAYADYRRTGFPKMFDPNTDEFGFTNASRAYPFSYPYRQLDVNLNSNAPPQKLIGDPSAKVFWDLN